jgi:flagellar biosynthetic protein FlhB
MSEDKDAKTEQPTAKRLSKARSEGNVPMSQEIKSLAMLMAGLVVVGTLAPWVASNLAIYLKGFLEHAGRMPTDILSLRSMLIQIVWEVGKLMAFPMFIFAGAAVISVLGQIGFQFTAAKLKPNLGNINPLSGFRQLFSLNSLLEAGKGVVKIAVVGIAIWMLIVPSLKSPDLIIDQDIRVTMKQVHWMIVMILMLVVMIMAALAAADLFYQRWSYTEKHKMTKQEVKDEHKESEGDPKVKGRIRALRVERHRKRMMANVPKATVVITNPTHYAVALKYDMDSMAAPVLVAKGVDYLAKRIRQIAETHEVPILENPPLARALYAAVEVDQEIPEEHYKAVAEVIGYVMRLKGKFKPSSAPRELPGEANSPSSPDLI